MNNLSALIQVNEVTPERENSDYCQVHDKKYFTDTIGMGIFRRLFKWCDHCEAGKEKYYDKLERDTKCKARQQGIDKLFPSLLNTKKYSKISFDKLSIDHSRQSEIFKEIQQFSNTETNNKSGFIFCGKGGEGKTFLACAIAKLFADNSKTSIVMTAYDIFAMISAQFMKKELTEEDIIRHLTTVDLLVIDEIEMHKNQEKEKARLQVILTKRHIEKVPTIITTNLGSQDTSKSPSISTYLGLRVMTRFKDHNGRLFVFDWESYRK